MDATLRQLVWGRAGSRCEYCRMAQEHDDIPFEIDHVIAEAPEESVDWFQTPDLP